MQNTKVLFLGDSIVKGVAPENGRYKVLDSSFYNKFSETVFSKTENKGRFGLTTEKFLKTIGKLKETDADIIFFSIGGNDCNYNWKEIAADPAGNYFPSVSKEDFEDNLIRIYNFFKENNMHVIAINYPPLHAEKFFNYLGQTLPAQSILKWLGNVSKIHYHHESYNTIFETVTRDFGIDLIDVRSRFLREDNLEELMSIDGMHPSGEGHKLIFRSISNHLLKGAIENAAFNKSRYAGKTIPLRP